MVWRARVHPAKCCLANSGDKGVRGGAFCLTYRLTGVRYRASDDGGIMNFLIPLTLVAALVALAPASEVTCHALVTRSYMTPFGYRAVTTVGRDCSPTEKVRVRLRSTRTNAVIPVDGKTVTTLRLDLPVLKRFVLHGTVIEEWQGGKWTKVAGQ